MTGMLTVLVEVVFVVGEGFGGVTVSPARVGVAFVSVFSMLTGACWRFGRKNASDASLFFVLVVFFFLLVVIVVGLSGGCCSNAGLFSGEEIVGEGVVVMTPAVVSLAVLGGYCYFASLTQSFFGGVGWLPSSCCYGGFWSCLGLCLLFLSSLLLSLFCLFYGSLSGFLCRNNTIICVGF